MKLTFQKKEHTQQPVKDAQVSMRDARSKKTPVLKYLGIIAALAVFSFAIFLIFKSGKVYTYGIISGQVQEIRAPFSGKVENLRVRRGDFVKKGDLLCSLVSQETEDEYAALKTLGEELLAKKIKTGEDDGLTVRKAQIEVKKLTELYQSKKSLYEKQKELLRMDAAVRSTVDAAYNAMQLAYHNLEQAKVDLANALNAEKGGPLRQAEIDLAIARAEPKKIDLHAGFDGVVMEVKEVEGNMVGPQSLVITLGDTGNIWLDLYIPPNKASVVTKGRQFKAYLPAERAGITCTIDENKGVVVRTPELLLEKMPNINTSIYTRAIFLEPNSKMLLPGTIVRAAIPY